MPLWDFRNLAKGDVDGRASEWTIVSEPASLKAESSAYGCSREHANCEWIVSKSHAQLFLLPLTRTSMDYRITRKHVVAGKPHHWLPSEPKLREPNWWREICGEGNATGQMESSALALAHSILTLITSAL